MGCDASGEVDIDSAGQLGKLWADRRTAVRLRPVANCTLDHDQRGQARPMGPNCDAGSVEIVEAPAGPDQAIKDLIAEVKALHLPRSLEASLVLKLELARVALYKGHKPAAEVLLTAFIVEVKSQAGKKIPAPAAAQLVTKATTAKSAL